MTVLTAAFRNRAAVAEWLAGQQDDLGGTLVIGIIAAGERWPDDSLRPAVEDLWGAGAVVAALTELGFAAPSPEASAAVAAFESVRDKIT